MEEALFGRYEAAALLAVEAANGGELAPLEQFLATYSAGFGVLPDAEELAGSLGLLIDAGLVEWSDRSLCLTVEGRRMLRKVGPPWQRDRPERLTERLSLIVEDDLCDEGERPWPTENELAAAIADRASWTRDFSLSAELQPVLDNPILGVWWSGRPPVVPPPDPD